MRSTARMDCAGAPTGARSSDRPRRVIPAPMSPRPSSRRHVLHVGHWYAQSHPTEDFAETFAVWLQPKARWRRDYAGWPALAKLEFVDHLMEQIGDAKPRVRNRAVVEPLSQNDLTLGEHYRRKRARYNRVERRYDAWLTRVFAARPARPRAVPAGRFIREIEPQLRRLLVRRDRLQRVPRGICDRDTDATLAGTRPRVARHRGATASATSCGCTSA